MSLRRRHVATHHITGALAPAAYDAVAAGVGEAASDGNISWSHTCGADATILVVGIAVGKYNGGAASSYTRAATYNGVPMTSLAVRDSGGLTHGFVEAFYLLNPPTGAAHTVAVATSVGAGTNGLYLLGGSVSYSGVGSVGTPVTGQGTSNPSLTVASAADRMVVGVFTSGQVFSAPTDTQRVLNNATPGHNGADTLLIEDQVGAASSVLGATVADIWAGIAFELRQAGGTPPGKPTITSITPNPAPAGAVMITGTNFLAPATVTFGGVNATDVAVVNDTQITCVTTSQPGMTVDVIVTTTGGASDPFSFAFPEGEQSPGGYIRGTCINSYNWLTGYNVPGYYPGGETAAGYTYMKSHGVDIVRIPIPWTHIQPTLGQALSSAAVARLLRELRHAADAGIVANVDVHSSGQHGSSSLGSGISTAQFADLWLRLADAVAGEPNIHCFDIQNEPYDIPAATWETYSQAAVTALRNAGNTTRIYMEGVRWSVVEEMQIYHPNGPWINDPLNNTTYSAHQYWDQTGVWNNILYTYYANQSWPGGRTFDDYQLYRLQLFVNWLNGEAPGDIGELNWPSYEFLIGRGYSAGTATTEAALWNALAEKWMTALDNAGFSYTWWGSSGVALNADPGPFPACQLHYHGAGNSHQLSEDGYIDALDMDTVGSQYAVFAAHPSQSSTLPTITGMTPDPSYTGQTVTITGTNFVIGSTTVSVGGNPATPTVYNSTNMSIVLPAHADGNVNVTVTTPAGTSAAWTQFTYAAPSSVPSITAISPNPGPAGPVTITGVNFASGATVSFGGSAATSVVVVSGTQITCVAPAHAVGAVQVTVTTGAGTSAGFTFTYEAAGTVLFNGSYAGGNFDQWYLVQNNDYNGAASGYDSPTYPLTIVTDPAGIKGQVARFELRQGDGALGEDGSVVNRSEVEGHHDNSGGVEGQTLWYIINTMFDATWPASIPGWNVSSQFHINELAGSPPVSFGAGTTDLSLTIQSQDGQGGYLWVGSIWSTPVNRGVWHELKLHIHWSPSDAEGWVELWHNGIPQTLLGGVTRYYRRTMIPGSTGNYYKEGYYRQAASPTGILYHTGFRCATTEAALTS